MPKTRARPRWVDGRVRVRQGRGTHAHCRRVAVGEVLVLDGLVYSFSPWKRRTYNLQQEFVLLSVSRKDGGADSVIVVQDINFTDKLPQRGVSTLAAGSGPRLRELCTGLGWLLGTVIYTTCFTGA